MSLAGRAHRRLVFGRRVERLAAELADRLPPGASVLDVGCGDGSVAAAILERRPDVAIRGVDVLVRPSTRIPVAELDGDVLPFDDGAFDVALLVDVLHHTDEPAITVAEARRVAPRLLIKDHLTDGRLAQPTLRAMDRVGNRDHGVRLPYRYLSAAGWRALLDEAGCEVTGWSTDLHLYPPPLSWAFDRQLHVLIDARRGLRRTAQG